MRQRTKRIALATLAALMAVSMFAGAAEAKKKPKPVPVKVMTRNIFLGADLTPALEAQGAQAFIAANGAIMREVDQTDFPRRAIGLAREIEEKKPDLIGLQEVAHWRTGTEANVAQGPSGAFKAVTTKYDFLQILLGALEDRGLNYNVGVEKVEFDFEAPADYDNNPNTGGAGGEITGRLTMRDVILVRDSKSIKTKNPTSGTYQNLYTPVVSGLEVPVTRGWTAIDVTVKKGQGKKTRKAKFDFVNTHFEAFDDETQRPSIRALQAQELTSRGGTYAEGPAAAKKVILLGDFNSNVPGVKPGDEQAFQTLLDAGFNRISTANPLSCCVSNLFTSPPSEFDHQVDHILTNQSKKKVKLVNSSVTGLAPVNGIYNSDHAGVFSKLKIAR